MVVSVLDIGLGTKSCLIVDVDVVPPLDGDDDRKLNETLLVDLEYVTKRAKKKLKNKIKFVRMFSFFDLIR